MRQDGVERTQTGIVYENYVEYHLLSTIVDSGPIEFDVSSIEKPTWILQILSYSSKLKLLEATETKLPMQITVEESTCFYIAYSRKSTSR